VPQLAEQQIFAVPARLSTQNPAAQSAVVVQAAPGTFFVPQALPSQAVELSQVLLVEAQAWVPSQALVVRVAPEHEAAPQLVPVAT
jgi:hypothetical protein